MRAFSVCDSASVHPLEQTFTPVPVDPYAVMRKLLFNGGTTMSNPTDSDSKTCETLPAPAGDSDSDWLADHEPMSPSERHAAMLEMDPGVYLRDGEGEPARPFGDIITATNEPPRSPEATVKDAAGRCLAIAHGSMAWWSFTLLGARRVDADARRDTSRGFNSPFSKMLADDIAGAA